jgi:hypothetical protein
VSRTTTYGRYWNQISLIEAEINRIIDLAVAPDWDSSETLFMLTQGWMYDSSPHIYMPADSLWRWDGDHWERIFHESLLSGSFDTMDYVQVSPEFADDNTVCFANVDLGQAYRSTNGGESFSKALSAIPSSYDASSWLVIDKNTRIVGLAQGGTVKTTNNGTTWGERKAAGSDPAITLALDPNNSDNILLGNDSGNVYLSTNQAGKWKIQPDAGEEVEGFMTFVAFDPFYASNSLIYAGAFDGEVYRTEVGGDTSWSKISDKDTLVEDFGGAPSLSTYAAWDMQIGPDGYMYVTNWDCCDNIPVARCVDPRSDTDLDKYFEVIGSDWPDEAQPWGLWLTNDGDHNTIFTIAWNPDDDGGQIWTYTDEVVAPVLSSPANNTSSLRVDEVTLRWQGVGDEYYVQVSEFVDFSTWDVYEVESEALRIPGLEDGRSYYWRVCIMEGEPALSLFSSTWKFTTQLSEAQWNPFVGGIPEAPYNGATDVPLMPSFAWNPADWATGYEFELADNSGFSPTIKSFRGAGALDTTVYLMSEELDYSTTYYWRVRAVSATSQSEWANGVFTTMGEAPAPPPPPPPAPTPPAPIVPAPPIPTYLLWIIIAIGALLVIAVIILIVRTRARI